MKTRLILYSLTEILQLLVLLLVKCTIIRLWQLRKKKISVNVFLARKLSKQLMILIKWVKISRISCILREACLHRKNNYNYFTEKIIKLMTRTKRMMTMMMMLITTRKKNRSHLIRLRYLVIQKSKTKQ